METEEVIKLVDNIYKNILDKFNPGARQLISAGKAYLKALHGTAAASRVFNEALAKIAVNAQQGGTNDIGSALMNIVGVYKDIQDQHMNILKAFYVDLLVPLETNLEKDTKVVQFEQKKFLQQHKIRADSYSKATATMKKQRKKKGNAQNADKEIKSIQAVDEEKNKLDAFCEQSLKNAMTQERRRYGFVLERQCSLAKHWIAYHSAGRNFLVNNLDNWEEVSASREFLPPNMENVFARQLLNDMQLEHDGDDDSDRGSVISAIRKTRSIDASCLDMRSIGDVVNGSSGGASHMPRAKSEFNLTSSSAAASSAVAVNLNAAGGSDAPKWDQRTISRGLYAYLSSGENQLSFLEGDRIALVGDRAKGWQFGENLRTHTFGWFPVAYTELEQEAIDAHNNWGASRSALVAQQQHHVQQPQQHHHQHSVGQHRSHSSDNHHKQSMHQHSNNNGAGTPDSSLDGTVIEEHQLPVQVQQAYHEDASPTRMFGDTIMYRQSKQFRRVSAANNGTSGAGPKPGPPPTLPAPVPTPVVPASYPPSSSASAKSQHSQMSQSQSFMTATASMAASGGAGSSSALALSNAEKRKSMPAGANYGKQVSAVAKPKARNGVAANNASLHSSNDSGFANEPAPPQPDIDYSDDETVTRVPIRTSHNANRSSSHANSGGRANATTTSDKRSSRIPTRRSNETIETVGTSKLVPTKSASTTLTRPSKSAAGKIRTSTSYGNLAHEEQQLQQQETEFVYRTIDRKSSNGNIIKRTKSFWKFGKGDDILEGMAMWRHRDLVPAGDGGDRYADDDIDDDDVDDDDRNTMLDDDGSRSPVAVSTLQRRPQRTATVAPAAVSAPLQKPTATALGNAHSTETLTNLDSNRNGNQDVGEYVVKNGMMVEERPSGHSSAGNKYQFTKSEIDSRISAMQSSATGARGPPAVDESVVLRHSQHQQAHANGNRNSVAAYETAPEEEEESIYDVQPKTRQMSNMNVMSRNKVIQQAYLENEREMNEQRQAAEKYRRAQEKNAYNAKQSTAAAAAAPSSSTNNINSSKKKKKTGSKANNGSAPMANPMDYYRADTPETIHHDGNVFDEDLMHDNAVRLHDTDFYDDESADDAAIMMKTVKRQDILKQYYNSSDGTDTEQNSTSSDAYDCIVVEDHHVVRRGQQQQQIQHPQQIQHAHHQQQLQQHSHNGAMLMDGPGKHGKMEFKTFRGASDDKDSGMESSRPGTLLPRTKLAKTSSGGNERAAMPPQSAANGKSSEKTKRSRADRSANEHPQQQQQQQQHRGERVDRSERAERIERSDRKERTVERRDRDERRHDRRHDDRSEHRDQRSDPNAGANEKFYRQSDLESTPSVKSYGPWYDLWGKDGTVHK